MKTLLFILLFIFSSLESSPTTLFWTPCTTQVVALGKADLNVDSFFSFSRSRQCKKSCYPTDVGATLGFLNWNQVLGEVGIDCLAPSEFPICFNAKIAVAENTFFDSSPSIAIGFFGLGTRARKHNQNIMYFVAGRKMNEEFPLTLYGAFYGGAHAIGRNRIGYMLAIDYEFNKKKDSTGREYYKWNFSADYASGNNILGGGGFALTYFFNPDIALQTGPVWFNTEKYNGKWKWSVQIDFTIPVSRTKRK